MADTTVAKMEGLFRHVYADKLEKLIPDGVLIGKDIPFVQESAREGNVYHQPVQVSREHGWTYDASGGTAFTLNAAESAETKDAQINGTEFVLRSTIPYASAARALKESGAAQKRAFVKATAYVLENMQDSAVYAREMSLIYGGGTAGAAGVGTINSRTNDSGTSQTFDLTEGTWADGIWAGMENAYCDVYSSAWSKRNAAGTMQITAVDLDNRRLTFSGTEAEMDNIVATDYVVFRGAHTKEMAGIYKMLTNTGTIWNIAAGTYGLWKASTTSAASGALQFEKVLRALNKPVGRGLKSEVCAYVSVGGWTDMLNDLSALRRYAEKAGGKLAQGADSLEFHGQNGVIKIKPHILLWAGIALILPPKYCVRVGATDITYRLPGGSENFMVELQDKAGWQMRNYFNQAWFCRKPSNCALINNIVNTA